MGCCISLFNISKSYFNRRYLIRQSSSFTQIEMIQLETFFSGIPDHCREPIIKLPARAILNLYQYHTIASYHALQRDWTTAIRYETQVIKGFQALLPTNKDHYVFFNFYSILSASILALGDIQTAIEGIRITLAILLKHTPTDYTTISNHYSYLAEAYQCKNNWKSTVKYLTKAIETARLLNHDLDQEYIHSLETKLHLAEQKLTDDIKSTESDKDVHRRITAKTVDYNAKHSSLSFDKSEFERLPNKQTELQITDEILKDVAKHLEKHTNCSLICVSDKPQFIAAQFKNIQMKTSSLSAAIIEAALTIIIDRVNDENLPDDELSTAFRQAPMTFSYTHDSMFYAKGVRVFQMERRIN